MALFRLALTLVSDPAEKSLLLGYISDAEKVVRQDDEPNALPPPNQGFRSLRISELDSDLVFF